MDRCLLESLSTKRSEDVGRVLREDIIEEGGKDDTDLLDEAIAVTGSCHRWFRTSHEFRAGLFEEHHFLMHASHLCSLSPAVSGYRRCCTPAIPSTLPSLEPRLC